MSRQLHIAFFGASLVSTFWNAAAPYYRGVIRALARRGHRVTFYEPDAPDRLRRRDLPDPDWATLVVYRANEHWSALRAVEQARGADLVIKAGNIGVYDDVLESAVLALKNPRTLVAFWDMDPPATLDRVTHHLLDPFRALIPRYDFILTHGGGDAVVSAYTRLGAVRCVPIYAALDRATHFPVAPDPHFTCDLAFLGHRLPDRENRVQDFFLHAAELLPQHRFLLAGDGWQSLPLPSNVRALGPLADADHNAFNASAGAVLNLNRPCTARRGFSPPTRLFEAAGAGACLISDAWPGLPLFLEPPHEILVAANGSEVAAHLAQLTRERAAAIGRAAHARVLASHTYDHRVAQLEALANGATAPASADLVGEPA